MRTTGTSLATFCSLIFYGKNRPDFVSGHIFIQFSLVYACNLNKKGSNFRFVLESSVVMQYPPHFCERQLGRIVLLKSIASKH